MADWKSDSNSRGYTESPCALLSEKMGRLFAPVGIFFPQLLSIQHQNDSF